MTSTIAILGASGLVGRSIISELGASDERILVFVGRDQTRLSAAAEAVVDAGSASPFTLAIGDDRETSSGRPPTPPHLSSTGACATVSTTAMLPTNWRRFDTPCLTRATHVRQRCPW